MVLPCGSSTALHVGAGFHSRRTPPAKPGQSGLVPELGSAFAKLPTRLFTRTQMRSGPTRALPCSVLPGRGIRPKACLDVASTTSCVRPTVQRPQLFETGCPSNSGGQAVLEASQVGWRACRSGSRANAFKRMSQEDTGANQAHHCRHCFDHRKTSFCAPREGNDVHPRTVKMIQVPQNEITPHWGFCATYVSEKVHSKQICVPGMAETSHGCAELRLASSG